MLNLSKNPGQVAVGRDRRTELLGNIAEEGIAVAIGDGPNGADENLKLKGR
jgi:hypothetical protein